MDEDAYTEELVNEPLQPSEQRKESGSGTVRQPSRSLEA